MIAVLNDVLAIGRLDAGRIEFQPRPLDLRSLCEHLIEEWAATNEGPQRIKLVCDDPQVPIQGDAKLLRHLLSNLIANGLKYSPADGSVTVVLTQAPGKATIAVQDRGIGIAEADRVRLFEPFFRGQNVGNVVGSGLGLAIVKRYADLHGARLSCESRLEEGSTFLVEFPAPTMAAELTALPQPPTP
ncbi:MAG: HAMP domain-containing histidine kinase [Oscillatoriales cyanobacterium SM2_1_8]|nr:HAMP domain-containing histidine kinase [Oscillatoriales cyanobacterium SM2_1_8]